MSPSTWFLLQCQGTYTPWWPNIGKHSNKYKAGCQKHLFWCPGRVKDSILYTRNYCYAALPLAGYACRRSRTELPSVLCPKQVRVLTGTRCLLLAFTSSTHGQVYDVLSAIKSSYSMLARLRKVGAKFVKKISLQLNSICAFWSFFVLCVLSVVQLIMWPEISMTMWSFLTNRTSCLW